MGPEHVGLLERLITIAISPTGGALMLGVLVGMAVAWYLVLKYYMPSKLKAQEDLCEQKIKALSDRLTKVEPIARKWEKFMERKAFEALETPQSIIDPDNTIG